MRMIKKAAKNILGRAYSAFDYPLVVNSYGRSGSTVLTKSIVEANVKERNEIMRNLAMRSISQYAHDLNFSVLRNGIVYKTHDYPPVKSFNNNVRMLYTFADPVDVILSLLRLYEERGEVWMKKHYDHLKVTYRKCEDIIQKDQLQIQNHFNRWLKEDRIPIAFIKYESMWNHQDDISAFLGFDIQLPPKRERKAKKNDKNLDLFTEIKRTYDPLREKVKKLDEFFIKNHF